MGRRKEGRARPEKQAEPREIGPSDAAPEPEQLETGPIRTHHSKSFGSPILDRSDPFEAYLPEEPIVYDSGWSCIPEVGTWVRVVFGEGPSNQSLRDWVRQLTLHPAPSDGDL